MMNPQNISSVNILNIFILDHDRTQNILYKMPKFEPVAYDHAAYLINERPWEVSRSRDLLFNAHTAAIKRYKLDECVVGIDIYNIEAEALGCPVLEPEGKGSPTIKKGIYASHENLQKFHLNVEKDGRCPLILDTAARLKETHTNCLIRIPICGPFTLAGHLLGLDNLLCDMALDIEKTVASLQFVSSLLLEYVQAAHNRGLEVIFFESAASPPLLSPKLFDRELTPILRNIIDQTASEYGSRPPFIIGGNTMPVVQSLLTLEASYLICPCETDQQAFVESILKSENKPFVRVNMHPAVFIGNDSGNAIKEAERTLQLASLLEYSSIGTILPFGSNPMIVDDVYHFVFSKS